MSESQSELDYLKHLWSAEIGKYDRTVLSLATGVLGLSAVLVRDSARELEWASLLLIGWLIVLPYLNRVSPHCFCAGARF